MAFETKILLTDDKVQQPTGTTTTYSGDTVFAGGVDINDSSNFNIDGLPFSGFTGSSATLINGIGTTVTTGTGGTQIDLGGALGTVSEPNTPVITIPRNNSIEFQGDLNLSFKLEQTSGSQGIITADLDEYDISIDTRFNVISPNAQLKLDNNSVDLTGNTLSLTIPDLGNGTSSLRFGDFASSAPFLEYDTSGSFGLPDTGSISNSTLIWKEYSDSLLGGINASGLTGATNSQNNFAVVYKSGSTEYTLAEFDIKQSSGAEGLLQLSDGSSGFTSNSNFGLQTSGSITSIDPSPDLDGIVGDLYIASGKLFVGNNGGTGGAFSYDLTTGLLSDSLSTLSSSVDKVAVDGDNLWFTVGSFIVRWSISGDSNQGLFGTTVLALEARPSRVYGLTATEVLAYDDANTAVPAENFGSGVFSDPRAFYFDQTSGKAYIVEGSGGNNIVHVYNIATQTRLNAEEFGSGDFGTSPQDITISDGKAYISEVGESSIKVYDVATGTQLASETLGGNDPNRLAGISAGVYVSKLSVDTLDTIDNSTSSLVASGDTDFFAGVSISDSTQFTIDGQPFSGFTASTVTVGLDPKDASNLATTVSDGNIDLTGGTFSSGSTIDSIVVEDGWRVLIKDQTDASENGIYDYSASASGFTRSEDFDGTPSNEVTQGAFTNIITGSTNANTIFVVTTSDPITVGVSDINFTVLSSQLDITAGDGIEIMTTGATNQISVRLASASGLGFNSGDLTANANNGLTVAGSNTVLGGALTGNTTITSASNILRVDGKFANGASNINAIGTSSHAEGYYSCSVATYSHAEGQYTRSCGIGSHSEGYGTCTVAAFSHTEGYSTRTLGEYSHAEGNTTIAAGASSHAEGDGSIASGTSAHAEGNNTNASGTSSHAEGSSTRAYGTYSHSEGFQTCAIGNRSHSEGQSTIAQGLSSHAEGIQTRSIGPFSHAEGFCGRACGTYAHAEGACTQACGIGSHAEGVSTCAIGQYSHSEGSYTCANGARAHSEGQETCASGTSSHSEGRRTKAYGNYSHSEGEYSKSIGRASKSSGMGTGTRFVRADGDSAFNHSTNTASQTLGAGALANRSAILGGSDHNIASGNTGATIIGGSGIDLTGTSYINFAAVDNLAIFTTPDTGTSGDVGLLWNPTDKKIKISSVSVINNILDHTIVTANTTITTSDQVVLVDSSSSGLTVTLPASPVDGLTHTIKDSGNNAATNNITVDGNGNNVEGGSTAIINTDSGSGTFTYNAANDEWYSIAFIN